MSPLRGLPCRTGTLRRRRHLCVFEAAPFLRHFQQEVHSEVEGGDFEAVDADGHSSRGSPGGVRAVSPGCGRSCADPGAAMHRHTTVDAIATPLQSVVLQLGTGYGTRARHDCLGDLRFAFCAFEGRIKGAPRIPGPAGMQDSHALAAQGGERRLDAYGLGWNERPRPEGRERSVFHPNRELVADASSQGSSSRVAAFAERAPSGARLTFPPMPSSRASSFWPRATA
jgi:hypothetical protein